MATSKPQQLSLFGAVAIGLASMLGAGVFFVWSTAWEKVNDQIFFALALAENSKENPMDYFICDEAQFYTRDQINQLAHAVDDLDIDVFAFGIASDFRTELFPGSARLFELADRIQILQVEALCWCGRRGTHNARTLDGVMVTEGEQVAVGDTASESGVVSYEVLCRRHHMAAMPINHLAD